MRAEGRSQPVGGAANTQAAAVQDVGIHHRRPHVTMAEKLLNRADVRAGLEQMRRERVTKRVAGRALGDRTGSYGYGERALNHRFVQVMPAADAGRRFAVQPRSGEDVLPRPVPVGVGQFAAQRSGEWRAARARCEIPLELRPHTAQVDP